jgi:hypothetical protein
MTVRPALIAQLLRQVADIIESMDAGEFQHFLASGKPVRTAKASASKKIDERRIEEIVSRLQIARTREEGTSLLERQNLSRRELVAVANAQSVHVTTNDNIFRIIEKLVEAIIGSRLNSLAIRGSDRVS